ncbi:MAG: hypothetical protein GY944_19940 [bacterium]|nr:hypothetical protein [bacterium]
MRRYDGDGLLLICSREYAEIDRRIKEYGDVACLNFWRYYRDNTIRPPIDAVTNILCLARSVPRRLSDFRSERRRQRPLLSHPASLA